MQQVSETINQYSTDYPKNQFLSPIIKNNNQSYR